MPKTSLYLTPLCLAAGILISHTNLVSCASGIKTGIVVPYTPKYVRSPYTTPPRLVALNNAKPGDIITCPYTNRNFIVPQPYQTLNSTTSSSQQAPSNALFSTTRQRPTFDNPPENSFDAPPQPQVIAPSNRTTTSSSNTTSVSALTPPPLPPVMTDDLPVPPPPPAPDNVPLPKDKANDTTPISSNTDADIPFGEIVPDKEGFLRSPFAEPHQLVDVTGLPPGSKVKCPYTNKIFRVPLK